MRAVLLAVSALAAQRPVECGMRETDPKYAAVAANASVQLPGWAVLDLDLPPEQRWDHLVRPKAAELKAMVDTFKSILGVVSRATLDFLEREVGPTIDKLLQYLPDEYAGEMRGIAASSGLPLVDIFLFNIMEELDSGVTPGCTSLVAQDRDGNLVHGRNLDFGLMMGWNFTEHQWTMTDKLRSLVMNVRFQRGGETVYSGTQLLGYVGVMSGMRAGAFSGTIDTRHGSGSWAIWDFIKGKDHTGASVSMALRSALAEEKTFASAVERMNTTKLLGPVYYTMSGAAPGEGVVLSREPTSSLHFWSLAERLKTEKTPYLLETNYDHWEPSHFFDRRTDYGNACMDDVVSTGAVSFEGVFQVLSAMPTRNRLTIYSILMDVKGGRYEGYMQHCPEKHCPLWGEEFIPPSEAVVV